MLNYLETALRAAIDAGEIALERQFETIKIQKKADNTPVSESDYAVNEEIIRQLSEHDLPVISEESDLPGFEERKKLSLFWLIDPIDGTAAYLNGTDEYTINIALIRRNEPVLGVVFAPGMADLWYGVNNMGAWKLKVADGKIPAADIMKKSTALPCEKTENPVILVTRSHMNAATQSYIEEVKQVYPKARVAQEGSSVKFCRVAEGSADIHLRAGSLNEWDTAAGDAVLRASGGKVLSGPGAESLKYNSESLKINSLYAIGRNLLHHQKK
ncbi:MAG: 3'(2'),5'-bisphosphate nucleotidase CysQ family protein [Bacteroidota bacterium]